MYLYLTCPSMHSSTYDTVSLVRYWDTVGASLTYTRKQVVRVPLRQYPFPKRSPSLVISASQSNTHCSTQSSKFGAMYLLQNMDCPWDVRVYLTDHGRRRILLHRNYDYFAQRTPKRIIRAPPPLIVKPVSMLWHEKEETKKIDMFTHPARVQQQAAFFTNWHLFIFSFLTLLLRSAHSFS